MAGDIRLPNESGITDIERVPLKPSDPRGRRHDPIRLRDTRGNPFEITNDELITRRDTPRKLTTKEREQDKEIQFRADFYGHRLPSGRRSLAGRKR